MLRVIQAVALVASAYGSALLCQWAMLLFKTRTPEPPTHYTDKDGRHFTSFIHTSGIGVRIPGVNLGDHYLTNSPATLVTLTVGALGCAGVAMWLGTKLFSR